MRGVRRPEDFPRLLEILRLDPAEVGTTVGSVVPHSHDADDRGAAGDPLADWYPTAESLRMAGRVRTGSDDSRVAPTGEPDVGADRSRDGAAATGRRYAGRHRLGRSGPRLLSVPTSLRGARRRASSRAVLGVLVGVALAAAVFAVRVEMARAVGRPQPVAPSSPGSGSGIVARTASTFGPPTTGPPSSPGAASSSAQIIVHVVGQVRQPGVYAVRAGGRVTDAVRAAGGPTRTADLSGVNLARLLVDGEQVRIPKPGESLPSGSGAGGATGGPGGAPGDKVNLNTADLAALDTLPGVGPVLAQRIVDWRSEHGRFSSIDELGEVSGIGEKMLAQLTPKVTL